MITNKQTIDNYFSNNYQFLLKTAKTLITHNHYVLLDADEIIADLYLQIQLNEKTTIKLAELIKKEHIDFWIINVIQTVIKSNKTFGGVLKRKLNNVKIIDDYNMYCLHDDDNEKNIDDYIGIEDIYEIAENLSKKDNNYWKYELWLEHYKYKQTYDELAINYNLAKTPIYKIVIAFNLLLRKELTRQFELIFE